MSWQQLKDILDTNAAEAAAAEAQPPSACPFDGTPLEVGKGGVRNCPMGNYRWDGGPKLL